MRRGLAGIVVLSVACGDGSGDGVSTPSGGSESSGSTSAVADTTDTGDGSTSLPADDTWDPSQCEDVRGGDVEWEVSLLANPGEGGPPDIRHGPEDTAYVLDGCLSLWTREGARQWQVLPPSWTCHALTLDAEGLPVVAGGVFDSEDPEAVDRGLVVALGSEGELRWELALAPLEESSHIAFDVVSAADDTLVVAGLAWPLEGAAGPVSRPWVSALDDEGLPAWTYAPEHTVDAPPQLVADRGGGVVVAEQRRTPQGVPEAVLTSLDAEGTPLEQWSSIEALGHPMVLHAFDIDPDRNLLLAGRDPTQAGEPHLLTMLDPYGAPRWVRSSIDISWLDHVNTVAFDPCGTLVLGGRGDPGPLDWGEMWVAKLDRQGELRWAHFLPVFFFDIETQITALQVEPDGSVLATGLDVLGSGGDGFDIANTWVGRLEP